MLKAGILGNSKVWSGENEITGNTVKITGTIIMTTMNQADLWSKSKS